MSASNEVAAMRLALEALERVNNVDDDCDILSPELANFVVDTIDVLKEALAKQEQEVDWKDMYEKEKRRSAMWIAKYEKDIGPLEYAVPAKQEQSTECVGEPVAYPDKCPITRRDFFMLIEHPALGLVPTYGGPFDSYTIPHMEGTADQPWHERELICHRFDHDEGYWMDDVMGVETIPLRVISDAVLSEFLDQKEDTTPQPVAEPHNGESVAIVEEISHNGYLYREVIWKIRPHELPIGTEIYTTSQPKQEQRSDSEDTRRAWVNATTWRRLTDEEIDQGLLRTSYAFKNAAAWRDGVRWAYHELKEKNT